MCLTQVDVFLVNYFRVLQPAGGKVHTLRAFIYKGRENLNNREGQTDGTPIDKHYFIWIRKRRAKIEFATHY